MRFCPQCGSAVLNTDDPFTCSGSMIRIRLKCIEGHSTLWESQPSIKPADTDVNIASTSAWQPVGNFLLAVSPSLVGLTFTSMKELLDLLKIHSINSSTYHKLQPIVCLAVEKYWKSWRNNYVTGIKNSGNRLSVAGDGRCDSPGYW